MEEKKDRSVSLWIEDVKQGNQESALKLWERYFERLVKTTEWKMRDISKRVADEEDIAISAFNSMFLGAAQGQYDQLKNREDLWKLLVSITSHKIVDQVRNQTSQKRGSGEVRGESIFLNVNDAESPAGFEMFVDGDHQASPEFMMSLEEEHQRLLELLRDDTQRDIATLKLEGLTSEEIAAKLEISLRSVERKLNLIRELWSAEIST